MPGTDRRKPLYTVLYVQVIVAIVIGVLLGYVWPETGAAMRPLGDGFIRLVRMMIAPIIFSVVVVGIAKIGDLKAVGRIGLKALIYFEVISTLCPRHRLGRRQHPETRRRDQRRSGLT